MMSDTQVDHRAQALLGLFDTTPDCFPWRHTVAEDIETRRSHMSDQLIFDIILGGGSIVDVPTLFPPADVVRLQVLLEAIVNSSYDALKRDSLVYYLLKWCEDGREYQFMMDQCIAPQFATLVDAYWHLDSGKDVPKAVSLLSDARLDKEYTSKILQALSLEENSGALIRRYVRTAKPLLTQPLDIDSYTIALADSSLMEAWQYQATYPESTPRTDTRERLILQIVNWCLTPRPRPKPLKQLLAIPWTPYEQSLIHAYAIDPPQKLVSASIAAIQELVCVRLIQHGQYASAIKLERRLTTRGRTPETQEGAKARKQMLDEFMALMPVAERQLLEVELEERAKGPAPLAAAGSGESWVSRMGSNSDLSMSWESVRVPPAIGGAASSSRTLAPLGEHPMPAISQRSGPLRLGRSAPADDDMLPLITPQANVSAATTKPMTALFPAYSSARSGADMSFAGSSAQHIAQHRTTGQRDTGRPVSLFDITGSANEAPNAFYTPPASAGTKRPFGQNNAHPVSISAGARSPPQPAAPAKEVAIQNDDVDMQSDDDDDDDDEEKGMEEGEHVSASSAGRMQIDEPGVSAEFSVSVFSPPPNPRKPQHAPRAVSTTRMPPGAFVHSEEEGEAEPPAPPPLRRQLPPRTPSPPATRTRGTRRSVPVKAPAISRTIPGGLVDEEEEEDIVPPLPPPSTRKPARKSRPSRSTHHEEAEDTGRRRSTRLSAVSSTGSLSPEPASPQKPAAKSRKSTRTTNASAIPVPTRSSARKKR